METVQFYRHRLGNFHAATIHIQSLVVSLVLKILQDEVSVDRVHAKPKISLLCPFLVTVRFVSRNMVDLCT